MHKVVNVSMKSCQKYRTSNCSVKKKRKRKKTLFVRFMSRIAFLTNLLKLTVYKLDKLRPRIHVNVHAHRFFCEKIILNYVYEGCNRKNKIKFNCRISFGVSNEKSFKIVFKFELLSFLH